MSRKLPTDSRRLTSSRNCRQEQHDKPFGPEKITTEDTCDSPENGISGIEQRDDQRGVGRLESLVQADDLEDSGYRHKEQGDQSDRVGELRERQKARYNQQSGS
jgi:hypothetical protein